MRTSSLGLYLLAIHIIKFVSDWFHVLFLGWLCALSLLFLGFFKDSEELILRLRLSRWRLFILFLGRILYWLFNYSILDHDRLLRLLNLLLLLSWASFLYSSLLSLLRV